MSSVMVIGGGVIGLSIAYELATRGHQVTLVERERLGQKSSWAGAGILTPANEKTAIHPLEKLEAFSTDLHREWSDRLLKETGIDNEFQHCGGLYLARTTGEQAALAGLKLFWQERQIEFEIWDRSKCNSRIPKLNTDTLKDALFVRDEFQLRNPRHLKALEAACRKLSVQILERQNVHLIVKDGAWVEKVQLENWASPKAVLEPDCHRADYYCFACGAWSREVFEPFEIQLPVVPVRGQVALFRLDHSLDSPIINEGSRYLVPRKDGHVIAGATVEEVGFDSSTNSADIADLIRWAQSLVVDLNSANLVKAWAGLRPGSCDGMPYIGKIGDSSNVFVATGHFKSGLHQSTGTAHVIADLIDGIHPEIDLSPFSISRASLGAQ